MSESTGITPAMLQALVTGRGLMAGTPEGIRAPEAEGKQLMLTGRYLPVSWQRPSYDKPPVWTPDTVTETFGLTFEHDPEDQIFYRVTLPDGWRVAPHPDSPDHDMWTVLIDGDDRVVANIFYKAAFYDRSAYMTWVIEPEDT